MEFRDFIRLAHEYLDQMQDGIEEVMQGGCDANLLNWIVDASDNMRRQAGELGLKHFSDIVHTVNDILVLAGTGKTPVTARIAKLIREAVRILNELLHEIAVNYQEEHYLH